jgi:NAD(P)-dependent dehydrogenase (short-subunit alcohol dehydrogenase family)
MFEKVDAANYADVVRLFRKAISVHGAVHHAIPLAGVLGGELWTPDLTPENIDQPPDVLPLEVNLKGTVYFARVALTFLNASGGRAEDRSLTMVSSIMPFIGVGVSALYQVSKSGVHELMRVLRALPQADGKPLVRINTIHPNLTVTPLIESLPFMDPMLKGGYKMNCAEDVAKLVIGIAAQRDWESDLPIHGMGFGIAGGKVWEMEREFSESETAWTGPEDMSALASIRGHFTQLGLPMWKIRGSP